MNYCYYCGEKLKHDALFCHKCGKQINKGENIKKAKPKKEKNNEIPIFEKTIGKLFSTDSCDIVVRLIKYKDSELLVDIRKFTHSGSKLNGLSFNAKDIIEFKDIMKEINYNSISKKIDLPPEVNENQYTEFETEDSGKCKSINIDSMYWDEKNDIVFNLLKFDKGINYIDIRKVNIKKDKRKMGVSIRIDLIPQFKEIINKIENI